MQCKYGMLSYNDVFDMQAFNLIAERERKYFIWTRSYEILASCAQKIKNSELVEAVEYAYKKGLELDLNADFKVIETEVVLHDEKIIASLWIIFVDGGMISKLTLEKNGKIFFEKQIARAHEGDEAFTLIYGKIVAKGNIVILKGHPDVDYLPLKIAIAKRSIPA